MTDRSLRTVRLGALWLWIGVAVVLTVTAVQQSWHVRSDILGLLPESNRRADLAAAGERFGAEFRQAILVAVQLPRETDLDGIAARAGELRRLLLESPRVEFPEAWAPGEVWRDARYHLFPDVIRERLERDPDAMLDAASRALFGVGGLTADSDPLTDPFGLVPAYLRSHLPQGYEPAAPGILFARQDEAVVLFAQVVQKRGAFDADVADALLGDIDAWDAWARTFDGTLSIGGLPVFSAHAASRAMFEVGTFGSASVIVIVCVLVIAFSSIRPLITTLFVVGSAVAGAFVLTHAVFAEVHVLTLVFGASLIGISVDYVFHYLCATTVPTEGPALTGVLPGITLAMLSSAAAFLSFAFTPFPGLQQVAVFAAGGLFIAWLTVVGLVPHVSRGLAIRPGLLTLAARWVQGWPHLPRGVARIVFAAIIGAVLTGFLWMEPNDDVQLLQTSPAAVVESDAKARALAPLARASQFFVVRSTDVDALLVREADLIAGIRETGVDVGQVFALSEHYPSEERQIADHERYSELMIDSGRLQRWHARFQLPATPHAAQFERSQPLGLERWLGGAPPHIAGLFLGCDAVGCASIVGLARVRNLEAKERLKALADPGAGVDWVDQVAEVSEILGDYRRWAVTVLLAVYALVGVVLLQRFGLRGGLRVVLVPVLAVGVAMVASTLAGSPFSLFTLLGVLLVTGIGIDYAIFYRLHGRSRPSTAVAIGLSAATTLTAFGLLGFSQTAVVHTFGVVVFAGILTAYVLAPLAAWEAGQIGMDSADSVHSSGSVDR